ncbi:unnamed protein product, partial [Didymodactylos carnosus]
ENNVESTEIIPEIMTTFILSNQIPSLRRCFLRFAGLLLFQKKADVTAQCQLEELELNDCSIDDLHILFQRIPKIKYLVLNIVNKISSTNLQQYFNDTMLHRCVSHLTYLKINIIKKNTISFDNLESLLKQLYRLETLILYIKDHFEFMNGYRWEVLISPSLPLLKRLKFDLIIFKLEFYLTCHHLDYIISLFKTDFWVKNKWYIAIDYEIHSGLFIAHTLPFSGQSVKISYRNTLSVSNCTNLNLNDRAYLNVEDLNLCVYKPFLTDAPFIRLLPNVQSLSIGVFSSSFNDNIEQGNKSFR